MTGFPLTIQRQLKVGLARIHPTHNLSGLTFRLLPTPQSFSWNREALDAIEDVDWVKALLRLQESREWDRKRNDVALLGCGAYGLPLARRAKAANISAVYVGALLSVLFGITGQRHRHYAEQAAGRAYWTSPLPEETPTQRAKFRFEPSAYW